VLAELLESALTQNCPKIEDILQEGVKEALQHLSIKAQTLICQPIPTMLRTMLIYSGKFSSGHAFLYDHP
jgi:hypothetical protein